MMLLVDKSEIKDEDMDSLIDELEKENCADPYVIKPDVMIGDSLRFHFENSEELMNTVAIVVKHLRK